MDYYRHLSQHNCDDSFLDLVKGFQQLYGIDDLSTLHQYLPSFERYKPVNDSSTLAHKIFYSNYSNFFSSSYYRILLCVRQLLDESFYYQSIPCVRFGFPGCKCLSSFHNDSDYNHPSQEINFKLAITRSYGTCALQIETSPGSGQYVPLEQDPGFFTFINHIECLHGSVVNQETHTMISLDFRLIPASQSACFTEEQSILTGTRFKPGSYFSESSSMNSLNFQSNPDCLDSFRVLNSIHFDPWIFSTSSPQKLSALGLSSSIYSDLNSEYYPSSSPSNFSEYSNLSSFPCQDHNLAKFLFHSLSKNDVIKPFSSDNLRSFSVSSIASRMPLLFLPLCLSQY